MHCMEHLYVIIIEYYVVIISTASVYDVMCGCGYLLLRRRLLQVFRTMKVEIFLLENECHMSYILLRIFYFTGFW